jgi:hypothetical protein
MDIRERKSVNLGRKKEYPPYFAFQKNNFYQAKIKNGLSTLLLHHRSGILVAMYQAWAARIK